MTVAARFATVGSVPTTYPCLIFEDDAIDNSLSYDRLLLSSPEGDVFLLESFAVVFFSLAIQRA
jgi:hypothetical protein